MKENCEYCDDPAFKTNGKSEAICESRAETGKCGQLAQSSKKVPAVKAITQGRNERCNCGSGLKFKNCCIDKSVNNNIKK